MELLLKGLTGVPITNEHDVLPPVIADFVLLERGREDFPARVI